MRAPRNLGRGAVVGSLAAVTIAIGACSGDGDGSEEPRRSATGATAVKPIKPVTCPNRSSTQKYMGRLRINVTKESEGKLWLMNSDVDCGQWSGKSNPTQMPEVGPIGRYEAPGLVNPFRLEVGSASRPQWRMRMVTKDADGTFKELYSFRLTFAPFPKRTAYRGLFLCFTRDCKDVTRVRKCPSTDPKNIDCGFPPEAPRQVGPSSWVQEGSTYRTPAFGGFKPFSIWTQTIANPSEDRSSFEINLYEVSKLG
ncbi:MAG: hypothetical protein ACKOL0_01440 [Solirubrobacterales bacterium]